MNLSKSFVFFMYVQLTEQHLKACAPQMEKEGQRTDRGNNNLFRTSPPSAISPDPSHCPIFNSLSHTSDHRDNMAEGKEEKKTLQITALLCINVCIK